MKILVAVDNNWAIGYRGQMLFNLPKDIQFFRKTTLGGVVVMGRSTLATMPQGRPLPQRDNIIISNYPTMEIPGARVTSLERLPEILAPYVDQGKELFLVGGGSVYRQLYAYCTTAIVTHVDKEMALVDAFFPNLSKEPHWVITKEGRNYEENGLTYCYVTYENTKPLVPPIG